MQHQVLEAFGHGAVPTEHHEGLRHELKVWLSHEWTRVRQTSATLVHAFRHQPLTRRRVALRLLVLFVFLPVLLLVVGMVSDYFAIGLAFDYHARRGLTVGNNTAKPKEK